jgi:hypothetical protein
MPGAGYTKTIIGASQVELIPEVIQVFDEMLSLLEIPVTVDRPDLEKPIETPFTFFDSEGHPIPVTGFAATGKATFGAVKYRDGVEVDD